MFNRIKEKGYTDTLSCPEGYELNRIVATTYSLEPQLIYLLACMFDSDSSEYIYSDLSIVKTLASFAFGANVKSIIEKKRLLVFYQQDKFTCKINLSKDKKFTALLRECCIPVKKEKYAFHPKVILAEYLKEEQILHRLIVSSRNLTTSDLFETQVVLEREAEKINIDDFDLDKLIAYINTSKWRYTNKDDNVEAQVVFQSPENANKLASDILKKDSSIIVLSPFFSGIKNGNLMNAGDACFYTGVNLHSKIFCVTADEESILWIGSANCTVNGLNHNYECMVGLKFKRDIQDEFKSWLEGNGFQCKKEPDEVESGEEKLIDKVVKNGAFKCDAEYQDGRYLVNIIVKYEGEEINELSIGLLGVRQNKPIDKSSVNFEGIEKHQLTNALLVKDKENNSRIVLAEATDEYKELLASVTDDLSKEKIEQLIPDFVFNYSNDDDSDDDSDGDSGNSTNNSGRESVSFSPSDEEYEKILKLYGYNRLDLLKKIKEKLEKNRDLYNEEKYEVVNQMLEALTRGDDNGI